MPAYDGGQLALTDVHLGHGGQHTVHGAEGAADGVARCGGHADDGPGSVGVTADRQRQGLRRGCAVVDRRCLLRVRRPGNVLSRLDRRWVAAVLLNRDMGLIARLPPLGHSPATALSALPAPRTPLPVADIAHRAGLPEAWLQHPLLCMTTAEGGISVVVSVSL